MKWFKKLFTKNVEIKDDITLSNIPNNIDLPNFADLMAEQIKSELEAIKQSEIDIKSFESLTQEILKDVSPFVTNDIGGLYFPYVHPKIRVANMGKVIDNHVKRALFDKKIKDLVSDDKNG